MPQEVYDAGGSKLVTDEEIGNALTKGNVSFRAGTRVNLVSPTGETYSLPAEDVPGVLREGRDRLESLAEGETRRYKREHGAELGESVRAFAEEAVSATPLVGALYDAAAADILGPEYTARRRLMREHQPIATGAGTLTSIAVPVAGELGALGKAGKILAAPTSLVSRGGGLAERAAGAVLPAATSTVGKAATRAVQWGVRGATEGAVYGASAAVSEAALGDRELTAELLLTGAGRGAGLGALLGAGAGTLAALGERALPAAAKQLRSFARGQELQALGATGGDLKTIVTRQVQGGEARVEQLAALAKKVTRGADTLEARGAKMAAHFDETGKALGAVREKLTKLDAAAMEAGERGHALQALEEAIAEAEAKVLAPLRKGLGEQKGIAAAVERKVLTDLREDLLRATPASAAATAVPAAVATKAPTWMEFLKGRMGPAMKKHGNHTDAVRALSAEYKALKAGAAAEVPHVAPAAVAAEPVPVTFADLQARKENIRQSVGYAKRQLAPEEKALDAVSGILESKIEKYADQLASSRADPQLLDRYRRLKADYGAAKELVAIHESATGRGLGASAASLKDVAAAATGAATMGPWGMLVGIGSRVLRASPAQGLAARATDWAATRVESLAKLGTARDRVAASLRRDVPAAIAGPRPLPPRKAAVAEGLGQPPGRAWRSAPTRMAIEYDRRTREHARSTPAQTVESVLARVGPVSDVAPGVGAAMARTQLAAQRFVDQALPRSRVSPGLLPGERAPEPAASEKAAWLRRRSAAADPAGTVLAELRDGRLSTEAVLALREIMPRLAPEMQRQIVESLADGSRTGKRVPHQQRLMLSRLFGSPLDGTERPEILSTLQASYASIPSGAAGAPSGAPTMRASRRQTRSPGKRETAAERIEKGGEA